MNAFKHIKIPEGAQSEIWKSIPEREEWAVPDAFFEQQAQAILREKEVLVPDDYFEKSAADILAQTVEQPAQQASPEKGKVRWINWVSISVAAAAVIGAVVVFYPKKEQSTSFADLFQKSELSDEEIIEEVSTEELIEVLPEEITVDIDTLINGIAADTLVFPDTIQRPIKPLDKKALPKWDDISTEEIMEYLMENGDDDLFN